LPSQLAAVIGFIKEPLLPLILRGQVLLGFSAEDLVPQQPHLFFQEMEFVLVAAAQRGDDVLEFGGVIREVVNVQTHAGRIAEAKTNCNTFLLLFLLPC
jgi:hypothetical protein